VTGGDAVPQGATLVCLGERCLAPAMDMEALETRLREARSAK
jgi:hypothetical protein